MRERGHRRPCLVAVLALCCAVAVTFLALPVVAIFVHTSPARLLSSLSDARSLAALRISIETTALAAAVTCAIGTPVAYLLATHRFPGRGAVSTVLELPIVLPPAVAGIGLLAALGPRGLIPLHIVLHTSAVVVALVFVSAPLYLRQAQSAFAAIDPTLLETARTLGAGPARTLLRVAVPVARPGLLAGLTLAWGRALGEFGATLMFAGALSGVTETAPLAIYDGFGTDLDGALALAAVLVIVSGAVLAAVRILGRRA